MTEPLRYRLTLYPEPVLRKVAANVPAFDDDLRLTVRAMFDLMYASNGVGLAAPQVGLEKRILVLNATGKPEDELALVNVTIVERTGENTLAEEGCLSFPGIYAEIKRPERCRVKAFSPDGTPIEREFDGFVARIIQHEYDHLEGVLLVDRMSAADKQRHKAALQDLVDRYRSRTAAAARSR
ncbi:MAG: peptide deformylase [Planctomycetes bacterium]|nr:peptide deformylase [Planctomycetota bacterium]